MLCLRLPGVFFFESDPATSQAFFFFFADRGASVLFRVCEPTKYLHAESQLHSMGRMRSMAWVQNSSLIGLCNHSLSLLSPAPSLALWLCAWQDRLLNPPPRPSLPNDEQPWLWLRRGIRCQLLVRVRLAGRRREAWHRSCLSGALSSHSHTENTVKSTCPLLISLRMLILLKSCCSFIAHTLENTLKVMQVRG